ncbi:FAD-dependent thymidylate synthase [compost metagenome]
MTASEWENFFALRANPDAQPELRRVAELMKDAYRTSIPTPLEDGQWHLPLLQDDEQDWATENIEDAIKVCCGRSARVSYLTHDGKRDHAKDIELYDRLTEGGHMSPLEHVARPMTSEELETGEWSGNFRGWHQHRKDVIHEDNFAEVGKN